MKNTLKSIVLLLTVSVFMLSCETEPKHDGYIISGTITGIEDGVITLAKNDVINRKAIVIDSATVENGKFTFKGKVDKPDQVMIQLSPRATVQFMLENSEISIKANAENPMDAKITGSASNDLKVTYDKDANEIDTDPKYKPLKDLSKAYNEAGQARDIELSKKLYAKFKDYNHLSEDMSKRSLKLALDFIENNGSSSVAPVVLGHRFSERTFSLNEMADVLGKFSGDAKGTYFYKFFLEKYNSIKRTSAGAVAPEFTLKNTKGEDVSLSSTKGKYVLLDFWASWCGPCRASYPHLKKVYSKYKAKGFEVLAISTDKNHDKWKEAIKEDGTEWIQVVDTFNREGFPSDIGTLYAVPYLPTTFLLDQDGVILAKNLSEKDLDKKLEEIFGF